MEVRRVGVAMAARAATAHGAGQYRPGQDGAEGGDLGRDATGPVGGFSAERHGYTFALGGRVRIGAPTPMDTLGRHRMCDRYAITLRIATCLHCNPLPLFGLIEPLAASPHL